MNPITIEKVDQAAAILKEKGIDLWLTFVRETSAGGDPVLPLIYGEGDLTWQSALLISADGERIAIVGRFEVATVQNTGAYQQVIPYDENIQPSLLAVLNRLNPRKIAINTSQSDVLADGLTHGMYLNLVDLLQGTPFADRLTPAEGIIAALRGRKTPTEVTRVRAAVASTNQIFDHLFAHLKPGMSEKAIYALVWEKMSAMKLSPAWNPAGCPIVNCGPDSPVGHVEPTDLVLQPGQIFHIDFGVRQDGYCSDLQRVGYCLKRGESAAPAAVQKGFDVITAAVEVARRAIQPGIPGKQVDAAARQAIISAGYPEYKYATGHQLGRLAHDGGALLGPEWARYGNTPRLPLEIGQLYTIEPGLNLPGYGYIGIEEDVVLAVNGAEFLGPPQTRLILV
jgi:Xaa-Pro aminopeptidase